MLPSIFGENLFDDFFDDAVSTRAFSAAANPLYGKHAKNLMKTDVKETGGPLRGGYRPARLPEG